MWGFGCIFHLPIHMGCNRSKLKVCFDLSADTRLCMNTITRGIRGFLYLPHSMNVRGKDTWLS